MLFSVRLIDFLIILRSLHVFVLLLNKNEKRRPGELGKCLLLPGTTVVRGYRYTSYTEDILLFAFIF